MWVLPFGLPEIIVMDQGSEFIGEEFVDWFREQGALVHVTDAQSPWQNGPTERAGSIFEELFDKVIDDVVVNSPEEYLLAAQVLVTQRNARVDRLGFCPDQLTFGRSIRIPGHMLSDDKIDADLLGAQASDPIRRMWGLQDAAGRACVTRRNVESCKRA